MPGAPCLSPELHVGNVAALPGRRSWILFRAHATNFGLRRSAVAADWRSWDTPTWLGYHGLPVPFLEPGSWRICRTCYLSTFEVIQLQAFWVMPAMTATFDDVWWLGVSHNMPGFKSASRCCLIKRCILWRYKWLRNIAKLSHLQLLPVDKPWPASLWPPGQKYPLLMHPVWLGHSPFLLLIYHLLLKANLIKLT